MTFKQLIKKILEHMSKRGMLDDLNKKYPENNKQDKTMRSDIGGTQ